MMRGREECVVCNPGGQAIERRKVGGKCCALTCMRRAVCGFANVKTQKNELKTKKENEDRSGNPTPKQQQRDGVKERGAEHWRKYKVGTNARKGPWSSR